MLIASERAVHKDRLKGYCVEHDPAKRRRIRSGLEHGASVRPVARAVLDLWRQEQGEAGHGLRGATRCEGKGECEVMKAYWRAR